MRRGEASGRERGERGRGRGPRSPSSLSVSLSPPLSPSSLSLSLSLSLSISLSLTHTHTLSLSLLLSSLPLSLPGLGGVSGRRRPVRPLWWCVRARAWARFRCFLSPRAPCWSRTPGKSGRCRGKEPCGRGLQSAASVLRRSAADTWSSAAKETHCCVCVPARKLGRGVKAVQAILVPLGVDGERHFSPSTPSHSRGAPSLVVTGL